MSFTCPKCLLTSHHPEDERNRYCGNCHAFIEFETPWVVMGGDVEGDVGKCLRCGVVLRINLPQHLEVFIAALRAFCGVHQHCEEKREENGDAIRNKRKDEGNPAGERGSLDVRGVAGLGGRLRRSG